MKIDPNRTEKEFDRDMRAFERLPSATKELEVLRDQAEKSTGPENVTLTKIIRNKADKTPRGQNADKSGGESQRGATP